MTGITLHDARLLGRELERYLHGDEPLGVPGDLVAMLRGCVIGEPFEGPDGLQLPPWRLEQSTGNEVELRWTYDLGHDSGTRRWFVARARRVDVAWQVTGVSHAHARRASW